VLPGTPGLLIVAVPLVGVVTAVTVNPALGAAGGTLSASASLASTLMVTGVPLVVVAESPNASGLSLTAATFTVTPAVSVPPLPSDTV